MKKYSVSKPQGDPLMKKALIVSKSNKAAEWFSQKLRDFGYGDIRNAADIRSADIYIREHVFLVCIIDAPLDDGIGDNTALDMAKRFPGMQVIFAVGEKYADGFYESFSESGIYLLKKPVHESEFSHVINMTETSRIRYAKMIMENEKLRKKLEEARVINRAKLTLMTTLKMTEDEAHHYIERMAMDYRITAAEAAARVLRMY